MRNEASTVRGTDESSPASSRKLVFSAVVVGVIVVLGLVLTLMNAFGGVQPTSPASPDRPATTAAATSDSPDVSVCGLDAVQMNGTIHTPPGATWTLIGTTAAPSITGQGPGQTDEDGYRSCYARTPTGALLAASNVLAMGSQAPLLGQKMTLNSTVPGPGRNAALARPPARPDSSGIRIQIAGFRLLKYDGRAADIDIALRTTTGVTAAQSFALRWVDGDWKILLAPSGDLPSPMAQLPSLSGFIPWSGA